MKDVRLLYFKNCPNAAAARANIRAALIHALLPERWEETDLQASDCPDRWRGFPSPTVLVDGADVCDGARSRDGASSCRALGAPSAEQIESRLKSRSPRASPRPIAAALSMALGGLAALGGLSACKNEPPPAAQEPSRAETTVTIPVEGMSCVACAARIKKTLMSADGVREAHVDLAGRSARVQFDPNRISENRLVSIIKELGYNAGPPKEQPR